MIFRRRHPPEEPPMHLTPLIDVVFVVLIAFIVIAPMLETEQVELAAAHPGVPHPRSERSEAIQIRVKADDSIWYRGQRVTQNQLEGHLRMAFRQHPKSTPVLIQDRRATFGTYQSVKQLCEVSGFRHLDVVLEPAKSGISP